MHESLAKQLSALQKPPELEVLEQVGYLRYRLSRLRDEMESIKVSISETDLEALAPAFDSFDDRFNETALILLSLTEAGYTSDVQDTRLEEVQRLLDEAETLKKDIITTLTDRAGINEAFYKIGANTTDAIPVLAYDGIPEEGSRDEVVIDSGDIVSPANTNDTFLQTADDPQSTETSQGGDVVVFDQNIPTKGEYIHDDVEDIAFRMIEPNEAAKREVESMEELVNNARYSLLPSEQMTLMEIKKRSLERDLTADDRAFLSELRERIHNYRAVDEAVEAPPFRLDDEELASNRHYYNRWQSGDPSLLPYNWWNSLAKTKGDIRVSLAAAGYAPDEMQVIFDTEINPWADRVVEQRKQKDVDRGVWGDLRDELLLIMRSRLEGRDPKISVFETEAVRQIPSKEGGHEESLPFADELLALREQVEAIEKDLVPPRRTEVDELLARIRLALEKAEGFVGDDPLEVERTRRRYLKNAKTNLALLNDARNASIQADAPLNEEATYVDLMYTDPVTVLPDPSIPAQRSTYEPTEEPTYVDLVKDDPLLQEVAQAVPVTPTVDVTPVGANEPTPLTPRQDIGATSEYLEARDVWRAASREYRTAAAEYETAYDHYLRDKSTGRKIKEKIQALFGKEAELPPDLMRLQAEYRSTKRQYAESLSAAMSLRSGVYEGNKKFSLEANGAKVAFGKKFILEPKATLNAIKLSAIEDATAQSRLLKVMRFMGQHRRATRAVGATVAASVGALTGGALGAGIGIGRWAVSTFGGVYVAGKVSKAMERSVSAEAREKEYAEGRATRAFTLEDLDQLDRSIDEAAFEEEKAKIRQMAATIGAGFLVAGTTAYAAGYIPRGVDVATEGVMPTAPREVGASAVERIPGVPFARVPTFLMNDLRAPNGASLPPLRISEIALVTAQVDGLPTDVYEIAKVRGVMLEAVKDFLAERPNITKDQLEAAVFERMQAKYGATDWWQKAGVKEIHVGGMVSVDPVSEVSSAATKSSFIKYGEVTVKTPTGAMSVRDINFMGNGKPVEIPDDQVYQVYGAIRRATEKILTERPGLTKVELEQQLLSQLEQQYGQSPWWKEVAISKVDIASYGSVTGEPAVASYSRDLSPTAPRPSTETIPVRTVTSSPTGPEVVQAHPSTMANSLVEPVPSPARPAVSLVQETSISTPRVFNFELAKGVALSPHVSEVVKLNVGKYVPDVRSVEVNLDHQTVNQYGVNEALTVVRVNVLTESGVVIETKAVGFGTITEQNGIGRLVMKAVEDLKDRGADTSRYAGEPAITRPGTGRLPVESIDEVSGRAGKVLVEDRVVRSGGEVGQGSGVREPIESVPKAKVVPTPPLEQVPSGHYLTSEAYTRYLQEQGITHESLRAQVGRTITSFEGKTYKGFWEEMRYRSPYQELGKMTVGEIDALRQKMWGDEAAVRQYALDHNFKYETLMKWANQIDVMKLDKTLPINENTPVDDWIHRYVAQMMIKERGGVGRPIDIPEGARPRVTGGESATTSPVSRETVLKPQFERYGITEAAVDRRVNGWVRSIERGNALLDNGKVGSPYKVLEGMNIDEVNRLRRIFKVDPVSLNEFADKHQLSKVVVRKWFNQIDVMTSNAPIPKLGTTFSDWFRHQVASEMARSGEGMRQMNVTWSPR